MTNRVDPNLQAIIWYKEATRLRAQLSPSWVKDARVSHDMDYKMGRRSLYLDVRFEIAAEDWPSPVFKWSPDIGARVRAALLIKTPSPKSIRIERRLLLVRASYARNAKARKVRASQ